MESINIVELEHNVLINNETMEIIYFYNKESEGYIISCPDIMGEDFIHVDFGLGDLCIINGLIKTEPSFIDSVSSIGKDARIGIINDMLEGLGLDILEDIVKINKINTVFVLARISFFYNLIKSNLTLEEVNNFIELLNEPKVKEKLDMDWMAYVYTSLLDNKFGMPPVITIPNLLLNDHFMIVHRNEELFTVNLWINKTKGRYNSIYLDLNGETLVWKNDLGNPKIVSFCFNNKNGKYYPIEAKYKTLINSKLFEGISLSEEEKKVEILILYTKLKQLHPVDTESTEQLIAKISEECKKG